MSNNNSGSALEIGKDAVVGAAPQTRRYVMKFGGSSLAGSKEIVQSASIIKRYRDSGASLIVVCSAMGDTTDFLLKAVEHAKKGEIEVAKKTVAEMHADHNSVIENTISNPLFREESKRWVAERFDEIDKALLGISLLRDLSPRSMDFVLSFGERLSAFIVCNVLASLGLKTKYMTGGEAGILTDETFGAAEPVPKQTFDALRANLLPLLEKEGVIPVITGYIAETLDKREIITLGRGGSDYSATLIAAAVDADEVVLWTDVDGILSADPRIVKDAKILDQVTYLEAMEMSAFGAKAMQPRALEPAANKDIPVRIRNTFRPEVGGTVIVSSKKASNGIKNGVKAVGSLGGVGLVSISGTSIVGRPGTAVKIFEILKELEVGILMMSQSVSENNVSLVIKREAIPKVIKALKKDLLLEDPDSEERTQQQQAVAAVLGEAGGGGERRELMKKRALFSSGSSSRFSKLDYEDDVAIVAVLGKGMIGTPGIAGRVFSTVAKQGINIRMIAQGSSEINISFVVKEKERSRAVIALHEEFVLGSKSEAAAIPDVAAQQVVQATHQ
ncbi:MAG TPA: aspartate kinase [Nitrososphaerales archaeon]|nr:aspartate kinase [Nitrososphaerales archaeon]